MVGPVPAIGRFGLAEQAPADLGREVLAAWDAFLDVVRDPGTDLSRPSRLSGWTGRDTCIHLGSWDDAQVMESVLASARTGALEPGTPPDDVNAALVRAHRDASDEQVVRLWSGRGSGSRGSSLRRRRSTGACSRAAPSARCR